MAMLSALLPSTMAFRGFSTFKIKQAQLRLERQRARAQRDEVFRITRELADCTDRQLADLGLCRSDIPAVAHGTYGRE
jgi:uncharacterized protein YjiS (DUF1127 family)